MWLPGFLSELRKDCGTIRREVIYEGLRKGFIITEIFITIVIIIMFKPVSRGLAIPSIFSENYKKIEGTVCGYEEDRGNSAWTGGWIEVKDSRMGKIYRFRDVYVPSALHIKDSVKMLYKVLQNRNLCGNKWKDSQIFCG